LLLILQIKAYFPQEGKVSLTRSNTCSSVLYLTVQLHIYLWLVWWISASLPKSSIPWELASKSFLSIPLAYPRGSVKLTEQMK
jgi:hypothetical protein